MGPEAIAIRRTRAPDARLFLRRRCGSRVGGSGGCDERRKTLDRAVAGGRRLLLGGGRRGNGRRHRLGRDRGRLGWIVGRRRDLGRIGSTRGAARRGEPRGIAQADGVRIRADGVRAVGRRSGRHRRIASARSQGTVRQRLHGADRIAHVGGGGRDARRRDRGPAAERPWPPGWRGRLRACERGRRGVFRQLRPRLWTASVASPVERRRDRRGTANWGSRSPRTKTTSTRGWP